MKKILFIILLVSWGGLCNPRPILAVAANPTPMATPTPKPILVQPNSNSTLTTTGSGLSALTSWITGLTSIFSHNQLLTPDFVKDNWLAAVRDVLPLSAQQQIKDDTTDKTYSAKYNVCVQIKIAGHTYPVSVRSLAPEISKPIVGLNELTANSELGNTLWGQKKTSPSQLDFTRPDVQITDPADCGINDTGVEVPSQTQEIAENTGINPTSLLAQILAVIAKAASNVFNLSMMVTRSQAYRIEDAGCNATGCNPKEVQQAPQDKASHEELTKNGGLTQNLMPLNGQTKESFGQVAGTNTTNNSPDTNNSFALAGKLSTYLDRTKCLIVPLEGHDTLVTDKQNCNPPPLPSTDCAELDAILSSEQVQASCTIKDPDRLAAAGNNFVDDNPATLFPEGRVPETMQKILEAAGNEFKVPASVILGVMYHEGAFSGNRYQWTESNVRKWSCGTEPIPLCSKIIGAPANFVFGWFPYWFYLGDGASANWNATNDALTRLGFPNLVKPKEETSPCNFLEAAFATAKALRGWTGALAPDAAAHNVTQCYGYNMTYVTPNSCGDWNDDIVAQTQVGYGGWCPEPGKHSDQPYFVDGSQFIQQTIKFFKAFQP